LGSDTKNLGQCISGVSDRRSTENLQKAIAAYEGSSGSLHEKDFPVDWAATQITSAMLIGACRPGIAPPICKKTIAAYEALCEFTPRRFPVDWAGPKTTSRCLSILPTEDRAASVQKAMVPTKRLCE